ncbi:hypothetical protein JCM10207_006346 [Rhodosporidiobolus poonsookiae]
MPPARTVKKALPSSSSSNNGETGPVPASLAKWQAFLAEETVRLRKKWPGMKGATIKKRASAHWKKLQKEEAEQDGEKDAEGETEEEAEEKKDAENGDQE